MRKLQSWVYGTMGVVLLNASTGCVSTSYIAPSGESFSYNRLGTQKITGLKIVKDKDGLVRFEFDTQEGEAGKVIGDLTEAIKNFSSTLKVP